MMNSIVFSTFIVTLPRGQADAVPLAIQGSHVGEKPRQAPPNVGALGASQRFVSLRAPIPIKLPGGTYFFDRLQIQISYQNLVLVTAGLSDDLAARVAEVTLSVKLSGIPGPLVTHAINGANKIAISDRVRRLLKLP